MSLVSNAQSFSLFAGMSRGLPCTVINSLVQQESYLDSLPSFASLIWYKRLSIPSLRAHDCAGKDGVVKAVYNNQFDPESHIPAALDAL